MRILKTVIAFIISLTFNNAFAQVNQDGPYITRSGKNLISKYILNNGVKTDTLKISDSVKVRFSEKPEWDLVLNYTRTLPFRKQNTKRLINFWFYQM